MNEMNPRMKIQSTLLLNHGEPRVVLRTNWVVVTIPFLVEDRETLFSFHHETDRICRRHPRDLHKASQRTTRKGPSYEASQSGPATIGYQASRQRLSIDYFLNTSTRLLSFTFQWGIPYLARTLVSEQLAADWLHFLLCLDWISTRLG